MAGRESHIKNSDILWAKIRKYALENGNAAASKKFSKASDNSLTLKPATASKLLKKQMHTNHKCQKTDFVCMPLY